MNAQALAPLRKVDDTREGRVPPNDLDAEAAVLSAILLHPKAFLRVEEILQPTHFYADDNRRIYECIVDLTSNGQPVDIVSVAGYLRDKGRLQQIGGSPYLAQLSDATPAVAHVEAHAKVIREKWRIRQLISTCQRFAVEGYGDVGDVDLWHAVVAQHVTALGDDEHGKRSGAAPLDAAAIFAPLEPIKYIIESLDLCPGAPSLWAGFGYSGKTSAAQSAALAIAAGEPNVWGCFAARPGSVLHIDYEQGSRLTRARYQRLAVPFLVGPSDLGDRLSLLTMPKLYLDEPGAETAFARLSESKDLVIIDSLRAAAPSLEENSSEIRRPLDMLSRISEKTGAAFVVIHHARKPNANQMGGAKMAIRGSSALFDGSGSVLIFEGEKGQPSRISHEKARVSGQPVDDFEIVITDVPDGSNPKAGLLVTAQGAVARSELADRQARAERSARTEKVASELRALFQQAPTQGGADGIAAKLSRKTADVRAALHLLVESGEVQQLGSTRDRRHTWAGRE